MKSKDAERAKGNQNQDFSRAEREKDSKTEHVKVTTDRPEQGNMNRDKKTEQLNVDRKSDQVHRNRNRDTSSDSEEDSNSIFKILGAVAGGALLFRGVTGRWPFSGGSDSSSSSGSKHNVEVNSRLVIKKSREEIYDYWRNLENLPNFMSHLEEVRETDGKRSVWTAEIPGGLGTIEWDAEIIQERQNHLIVWRSLPGSEIENSGEVRFENAPGGKGTIVDTTISYRPPGGDVGSYIAQLFNPAFKKTVEKDLKQFKKHMEKGKYKKFLKESRDRQDPAELV